MTHLFDQKKTMTHLEVKSGKEVVTTFGTTMNEVKSDHDSRSG